MLQVALRAIDPILRRHTYRICKVRIKVVNKCRSPKIICQLVKTMLILRKHFLVFGLRNALPMLAHLYNDRLVEGIVEDHTGNRERAVWKSQF